MVRPLRVQYEGAIYHVTVRGNARQEIFRDDRDRRRFCDRLGHCVETHRVRLYQFCLMPNHVHLMFETPAGDLCAFMHRLLTAYTVYFNRRHGRSGHLTQGRYGASVVRGNRYLLRLSRYIHLNPVFVRGAKRLPSRERIAMLRKYTWSSYRGYIGRGAPMDFVDDAPMLAMMDVPKAQRRDEYRKFVESGVAESDEELRQVLAASPLAIGSDAFVQWARRLHDKLAGRRRRTEDVTLRRRARNLPPQHIIEIVCGRLGVDRDAMSQRRRGSLVRPIAARMLCRYAGLTQRQTAALLDLSTGAAVSLQLKALAAAAAGGPGSAGAARLRKQLSAVEKAIRDEIDRESEDPNAAI